MEPQATKTETNELEGAKTLRQAAGDCRVALADLIGPSLSNYSRSFDPLLL